MKTLALIAVAGMASTAMARSADGHLGSDFENMLNVDSVARGTANFTTVVDVDGSTANAVLGDPSNMVFTVNIGAGNSVTGLAWDIDIETIGDSWLSDVVFNFDDSTGANPNAINLSPAPGDGMMTGANDMPGSGNFPSGGIVDFSDNGLGNITVGADGLLVIELFDVFDDNPAAADAFVDGSITIGLLNDVPAPGAAALFGLGGLAAARRRR